MPSKRSESQPLGPRVGANEMDAGRVKDEYDKSKFYIASTDKHHQNERLRASEGQGGRSIRVPPFLWASVCKWVDDDRTPYRTTSDFIRDSVYHRVVQLEELAENAPETWMALMLEVEMHRKAEEAEKYRNTIANAKKIAMSAWQDGNLALFFSTLDQAERLAGMIPEPYAGQLKSYVSEERKLRRIAGEGS